MPTGQCSPRNTAAGATPPCQVQERTTVAASTLDIAPGHLFLDWPAASAMEVTCSLRSGRQRAPWRDREEKTRPWSWRQQGRGEEAKTGGGPPSSSLQLHPTATGAQSPPLFTGTDPPPVCAFFDAAAREKSEGEEEAAQWREGEDGGGAMERRGGWRRGWIGCSETRGLVARFLLRSTIHPTSPVSLTQDAHRATAPTQETDEWAQPD